MGNCCCRKNNIKQKSAPSSEPATPISNEKATMEPLEIRIQKDEDCRVAPANIIINVIKEYETSSSLGEFSVQESVPKSPSEVHRGVMILRVISSVSIINFRVLATTSTHICSNLCDFSSFFPCC